MWGDPHVHDFHDHRFDLHTPGVFQVLKMSDIDIQVTVDKCVGLASHLGCNSQLAIEVGTGTIVMSLDNSYRNLQVYVNGARKSHAETIHFGSKEVMVRSATEVVMHTPDFEVHGHAGRWKTSDFVEMTVKAKGLVMGLAPGICGGAAATQWVYSSQGQKLPCSGCSGGVCTCDNYRIPRNKS